MTVKYWHLRAVDSEQVVEGRDVILPHGGLTVAYTVCQVKGVNSIFVNIAKCRTSPIVVAEKVAKREAAIDAEVLKFSLGTYPSDAIRDMALKRLRLNMARINRWPVHTQELFCYESGRKAAKEALEKHGPLEILDLEHPISLTIADWVANSLWPAGPAVAGYVDGDDMGFAIDMWKDNNHRWVSDFYPSQGVVVEGYEEQ